MNLVPLLSQIGTSGALPSWVCPAIARISGFSQMLTTAPTVAAVLDIPEITVPYGERSSVLGLGDFPLALDGDDHQAARALIGDALRSSAEAQREGLAAAEAVAAEVVVRASGGRLDVAGEVVDPALIAWVERWFGLEGLGPVLLRSGRMIMHATFLNPTRPAANVDAIGLRRAVEWVRKYRQDVADAAAASPPGTLARALVDATGSGEAATNHLFPLTVGPFGLGAWALDLAIDYLLDRSWVLDGIETDEQGAAAFEAAVHKRGPLPGVKRENKEIDTVREVKGRNGQIRVPPGPLLASTACADRGGTDLFAFSSGIHSCMGHVEMGQVSGRILRVLGSASPRRIDGPNGKLTLDPKPSGFRKWPFPGRLEVQLLR